MRLGIKQARVCLTLALLMTPFKVATAEEADPTLPFEKYQLDNGLEVILHQDDRMPLVAVNLWYHVGAGDEIPGKSGYAHLFEHMLFQGSQHVGEDKHFDILKNIGATGVNGTTNFDRTNYFETVPSHQLETALWLESDRMGYLLPLVTRKSLDNQIEVVRNERRQRTDNVPYGKSRMQLFELLYPEGHPYRGVVIGEHKDLAAATEQDIIGFFKTWYVPANATLGLAGDFDRDEAKRLIQKWFGSFPKQPLPEHKIVHAPKIKHQRKTLVDNFAKLRQVTYAWHTPARYEDGDADFEVVSSILASEAGRLTKLLVHEKQWAQDVNAYQWGNQMSGAFFVSVDLKPDAPLDGVEKILDEQIGELQKNLVTKEELARAVTGIKSSFIWHLESLNARLDALQEYNHYLGSPDYIAKDLARFRKVTPESIRAHVQKFLNRDHRVEVVTMPKPDSSAG